jgi:hypothetical protein
MADLSVQSIIFDCTIRNSNYAVDFKFNVSNTSLVALQLANLRIAWIEVRHDMGLGAMPAPAGPSETIRSPWKALTES